jgi:hypothetical protein
MSNTLTIADPAFLAGGAAYDFLNPGFTWNEAGWASDPLWSAPADGAAVASLRNPSGNGDPTQATVANRPIFRAAPSGFNGHPAIEFDGSNDSLFADLPDIAQPFQLVVVLRQLAEVGTSRYFIGVGGAGARGLYRRQASDSWSASLGAEMFGGTADLNTHILHLVANGASSSLVLDGTTIATGTGTIPGTGGFVSVTLGASVGGANNANVQIAGWGIIADASTSMAALTTATKTYYAIP